MSTERIPLNADGVARMFFAIRTLLIGLEFDESTQGELLIKMAEVIGLHAVGVGRDDPSAPARFRIEGGMSE